MSFGQTIVGYKQYYDGKKAMRELGDRPKYEIPEEAQQNLTQAQLRSMQGLSADAQRQYVENIQRSMQTANMQSNERGGGLANIATQVQQQNDAFGNLLQMDEQQRNANVQDLYKAREGMAQQQLQAQEVNTFQPYRLKYNEAKALLGAGMQNVVGGWQGIANIFGGAFGGGSNNSQVGNVNQQQNTQDNPQMKQSNGLLPNTDGPNGDAPNLQKGGGGFN